eukprot:1108548-Amphidinium_carterae.1
MVTDILERKSGGARSNRVHGGIQSIQHNNPIHSLGGECSQVQEAAMCRKSPLIGLCHQISKEVHHMDVLCLWTPIRTLTANVYH